MQSPQGGSMPGVFDEYHGGQGLGMEETRGTVGRGEIREARVSDHVAPVCHGKVLRFYSESQR